MSPSALSRDGFLSGYFFRYFLLLLVLCSQILLASAEWSKTMQNMKIHHRYAVQEAIVLDAVKCRLKQNNQPEGTYEAADISFSVTAGDPLQVSVFSPHPQQLEIQVRENQIESYQAFYPEEMEALYDDAPYECGALFRTGFLNLLSVGMN